MSSKKERGELINIISKSIQNKTATKKNIQGLCARLPVISPSTCSFNNQGVSPALPLFYGSHSPSGGSFLQLQIIPHDAEENLTQSPNVNLVNFKTCCSQNKTINISPKYLRGSVFLRTEQLKWLCLVTNGDVDLGCGVV